MSYKVLFIMLQKVTEAICFTVRGAQENTPIGRVCVCVCVLLPVSLLNVLEAG